MRGCNAIGVTTFVPNALVLGREICLCTIPCPPQFSTRSCVYSWHRSTQPRHLQTTPVGARDEVGGESDCRPGTSWVSAEDLSGDSRCAAREHHPVVLCLGHHAPLKDTASVVCQSISNTCSDCHACTPAPCMPHGFASTCCTVSGQ